MRIFLCLGLMVSGCGDSTTTTDAGSDGGNDTGSDVVTTNDASNDVTTNDASTDAGGGEGGLQQGDVCDPQNNQCASAMLCCSEPTHNFDGGPLSQYVCEQPSNGQCPKLP